MAVLVVDDDSLNRDLLSRRLRKAGYETAEAASGGEALDLLARRPFDLVLLDVEMPGGSGLEVLAEIRSSQSPLELPVIMVTGEVSGGAVVHALEAGANDYVTKPVDFPVALARVKTHLSLRNAMEALRRSEERYALAARGARDGLWDWDLQTGKIFYSARWASMLGYGPDELGNLESEWLDRVHPDDVCRLRGDLDAHLNGGVADFENEHRLRRKDGSYRWMLSRGLAVWDKAGIPVRMVGSQTDVTAGKIADPLTGLANRVLFLDRLERAILRTKRSRDLFAVLFLDVDRFKNVNDSLGHLIGDQLLQEVAARLRAGLRAEDTVSRYVAQEDSGCVLSRLGGDEFAVLVENVRNLSDVVRVAERMANDLREPFRVQGSDMFVTASVGIALSSEGYDRPEDVLRDADTAMYFAKENGRARFAIFDGAMRTRAVTRLQMETDLRHALERNELELFYQPIVELRSGWITGFEALVRWRHPERGLIHPGDFIPVAEETGLILPMGQWILREACRRTKEWQALAGGGKVVLHVNFSARQLDTPDLAGDVARVLREFDLDTSWFKLNVEITESAVLEHSDHVEDAIRGLAMLGVGVSIDDFGTGYSSLSQLQRFPVQTLKIDRTFVNRVKGAENTEIIRTIIGLAHHLGMEVVAEGVETAEQVTQLIALGCEYAQGYYFSVPVDGAAAAELLATRGAACVTVAA